MIYNEQIQKNEFRIPLNQKSGLELQGFEHKININPGCTLVTVYLCFLLRLQRLRRWAKIPFDRA